VVLINKISWWLTNTTPSARNEVASRHFINPRIHPSSAEEGSLYTQFNESHF
jgi:hypothetical protein